MIEYKQYHPFLRDILEFVVRGNKDNLESAISQEVCKLLAHNKSINKSNVLAARNRRQLNKIQEVQLVGDTTHSRYNTKGSLDKHVCNVKRASI